MSEIYFVASETTKTSRRKKLLLFEDFFREKHGGLVFFANQLLQNKEAAEDVVQDVYTAVRNACLNYLRNLQAKDKFFRSQPVNTAEESFALQRIIKTEAIAEVYKAIEALPEGCRLIFKLGYLEGINNQQIADHLLISINTVKQFRALQLLRLKLSSKLLAVLFLF